MIANQPKLRPLLEVLEKLHGHGLMAVVVVAAFHHQGVLPLMARRQHLFEMTPDEPIEGVWLSAITPSNEEILHRPVKGMVDGWMKSGGPSPFPMRPSRGYISLVSWALPRPSRPSCLLLFSPVALFRRFCRG